MTNKDARNRLDGMQYACRRIREIGLEEFEKELKWRGARGISIAIKPAELEEASDAIKRQTIDTITILAIAALHDEFGFGRKRLEKFQEKFTEGIKYLNDGLAYWDDYIDAIKEETGIDLTIMYNDGGH